MSVAAEERLGGDVDSRKGFNLIELLVVIVIIALLLSVIMPVLQLTKRQACKVICTTHLNSIGKAIESYGLTYACVKALFGGKNTQNGVFCSYFYPYNK